MHITPTPDPVTSSEVRYRQQQVRDQWRAVRRARRERRSPDRRGGSTWLG